MPFVLVTSGILLFAGIYFTVGTGFFQFRHLSHIFKSSFADMFRRKSPRTKGSVSPFQALSTALAGSVGTGNIVGVSGALAIGGPGAIFWMWVSALFGMIVKYAEVMLALKYRRRGPDGMWVGGPMLYIERGMGVSFKWLAVVFAILGAVTTLCSSTMTQMSAIAGAVESAAVSFFPKMSISVFSVRLISGLVVAGLVGVVLLGGVKRINDVAGIMVPFMSIVYVGACLYIIGGNLDRLGPAFALIVKSAFTGFRPVLGGGVGLSVIVSFKSGMARGIFSNEAGVGSAPIAHAAADTNDPVKQGMLGIVEVFIDTIVICTMTGLILLVSGIAIPYGADASDVHLARLAFCTMLPENITTILLAFSIAIFAFTSIIGWALYGVRCIEYLFGEKAIFPYKTILLLMVAAGSVLDVSMIWKMAELMNGIMAMPNIVALIALSKEVFLDTRNYKGMIEFWGRRNV